MKHYSQISFVICALATLLTSLSLHYAINRLYISSSRRQNGLSPATSILLTKF
jgi:hypothetical protein